MYNRPAWMSRGTQGNVRAVHSSNGDVMEDTRRKKSRIWIFTAQILATPAANINPSMPLDVDYGTPGIELWFGKYSSTDIGLLCHLDS